MLCWKCGKETGDKEGQKIDFRAECPHCVADLHCCRQCAFYKVGQPNNCTIPGTEFVDDREKMNYCEDFKPKSAPEQKKGPTKEEIEKRLFGGS